MYVKEARQIDCASVKETASRCVLVLRCVELHPGATRRTFCVFAIRRVHDRNWLQEARDTNFFLLMYLDFHAVSLLPTEFQRDFPT